MTPSTVGIIIRFGGEGIIPDMLTIHFGDLVIMEIHITILTMDIIMGMAMVME